MIRHKYKIVTFQVFCPCTKNTHILVCRCFSVLLIQVWFFGTKDYPVRGFKTESLMCRSKGIYTSTTLAANTARWVNIHEHSNAEHALKPTLQLYRTQIVKPFILNVIFAFPTFNRISNSFCTEILFFKFVEDLHITIYLFSNFGPQCVEDA